MGLPFVVVQGPIFITDALGNIVGTKSIGGELDGGGNPLIRGAMDSVIEGVLDDTATVVATEGQPAPGRITPYRAHHVNLRKQDGTELGTITDPIIVSPTQNANFVFGDITTAVIAKVVVRRTTYTEQAVDAQRQIISSNVNDAAAGTGARTVRITYFTDAGVGPLTETVTLNGTTVVNTVATNICFIEKMQVVTAGSGGVNAGTISIRTLAAVAFGSIAIGDNQTFWAHHYIATGKTCNITGISAGHNGTTVGSGALFTMNARPIGVANAVDIQVSDFVRLYGQSSTFSRGYDSPIKVVGPARLTMFVLPETGTSVIYRCAVDFFEP